MRTRPTLPAKYASLLVRLLEEQGFDCSDCLATLHLDKVLLAHPAARLSTAQMHALFQRLMDRHGGADLGLQLGRMISPGLLGHMGHAIFCSATLADALDCCQEFHAAMTPSFRMTVKHQADHADIVWVPVQAVPYEVVLFSFDMMLSAFDATVQRVAGPSCPRYDAHLTRAEPTVGLQAYRQLRARCHFGEPGIPSLRLRLPRALLDSPMPLNDPEELAVVRERLQGQPDAVALQGQVSAWVRMMLGQTRSDQPSLAFMAQVLGVSSRTLARQMAVEGVTYRDMARQIRFERACELLRESQWRIEQISELLGYANVPSFVRAFKAEAGIPPGAFRSGATQYSSLP